MNRVVGGFVCSFFNYGAPFLLVCLLFGLSGCASGTPRQINIMPAPDIYSTANINPFPDRDLMDQSPYRGMLYVTDRLPNPEPKGGAAYLDKRGHVLRAGLATISFGEGDIDWEEARRISLLKNRPGNYPLKVEAVEEFGLFDFSDNVLTRTGLQPTPSAEPGQRFAELIDAKLDTSKNRDIYIYVHGYKVVFENPLLVASELWHFLGYDGVFIAYAWPSTPDRLAYFSDLETATLSSSNLREFLIYLAKETSAERIHILGYSAGTRVVAEALWQLALQYGERPDTDLQKARLGNVILVGSDIDRQIFAQQLSDGLLDTAEQVTVYLSDSDKALGLSRWLFAARGRMGQAWKKGPPSEEVRQYLLYSKKLNLINVSGAEGSSTGNGHAYFRTSPWVSSDILMTLFYGLSPGARGLIYDVNYPAWYFPADYLTRLRKSLLQE